jgi:hypothetical protein
MLAARYAAASSGISLNRAPKGDRMHRLRPLSNYPAPTLDALRAAVAALLRYQDMLPTDLYVKLSLFRDDITGAATVPGDHPAPRWPGQATAQPRHRDLSPGTRIA